MVAAERSDHTIPNSVVEVSKQIERLGMVKCIAGPLTFRRALGLSQAELGQLLAHYTHKQAYTRSTISVWERVERGVRLPGRYAMTPKTRQAYALLLADVVQVASDGRYFVNARLGARRWHVRLAGQCRQCGRGFTVPRVGVVRCPRCQRR